MHRHRLAELLVGVAEVDDEQVPDLGGQDGPGHRGRRRRAGEPGRHELVGEGAERALAPDGHVVPVVAARRDRVPPQRACLDPVLAPRAACGGLRRGERPRRLGLRGSRDRAGRGVGLRGVLRRSHRDLAPTDRADECAGGRPQERAAVDGLPWHRGGTLVSTACARSASTTPAPASCRSSRPAGATRSASTRAGRPSTRGSTSATRGRSSCSACSRGSWRTRATSRRWSSTSPTSTTRSTAPPSPRASPRPARARR